MPNAGKQVVAAPLASTSLKVDKNVELMSSSIVPNNPEVRYFNREDKDLAEKALAEFQKLYKTAVLKYFGGLPAPMGQIEIWLPRIAGKA